MPNLYYEDERYVKSLSITEKTEVRRLKQKLREAREKHDQKYSKVTNLAYAQVESFKTEVDSIINEFYVEQRQEMFKDFGRRGKTLRTLPALDQKIEWIKTALHISEILRTYPESETSPPLSPQNRDDGNAEADDIHRSASQTDVSENETESPSAMESTMPNDRDQDKAEPSTLLSDDALPSNDDKASAWRRWSAPSKRGASQRLQ